MVVLLLVACAAHQVSWQETYARSYPVATTEVAVVAMEKDCRPLADALVDALGSRPGVDVKPGAAQKIFVSKCDELVTTTVDIEGNYPGLDYGANVYFERRRYTLHGWARGEMEVQTPGIDPMKFSVDTERDMAGGWVTGSDIDVPASPALHQRLSEAVASGLADKLVPLPETLRRTVYADPEPGTARQLHNDAVAAERAGNLEDAMRLAKAAYAADPSPEGMDYVELIEHHAESVGYAFLTK